MRIVRLVSVAAFTLTVILLTPLAACKKDNTFKIERVWTVVEVTREGHALPNFTIKQGDVYNFKAGGIYTYTGTNPTEGQYSFSLDNKRLVLDNQEFYVYYAEGKELSFGLVRLERDMYTVKLKAK